MFTPQGGNRSVAQKGRCGAHGARRLLPVYSSVSHGHYAVYALTSGFLHPRCLESIYTYTRRIFNIPQKSTKFWLNLHACHLVTRKALNVRMGKGKGSKLGVNARIAAGTCIVRAMFCRLGLWSRYLRFVNARCSFRTYHVHAARQQFLVGHGSCAQFHTRHAESRGVALLQRRYVSAKILEVFVTLQRLDQLQSYIYFRRLFQFYGRRVVPLLDAESPLRQYTLWVQKYMRSAPRILVDQLGEFLLDQAAYYTRRRERFWGRTVGNPTFVYDTLLRLLLQHRRVRLARHTVKRRRRLRTVFLCRSFT
jgi:ribosomal protein L16/L10AE